MEIFKWLIYICLLVGSNLLLNNFFNKLKMKYVSIFLNILVVIISIGSFLYCCAGFIRVRLGDIYQAETVFHTFILMLVDTLYEPVVIYKSFTIGFVLLAITLFVCLSIITAYVSYFVSEYIKNHNKEKCYSNSKSFKVIVSIKSIFNDFRNLYLLFRKLLN